ncbi:MAG: glutaredoxin 3 [Pseudomonadota bacterium]
MPKIEVYASMWCGYCARAKALLARKGVTFTEYDVDTEPGRRQEMVARGGGYTVPQIFVDGRPVGGCDDIHALDAEGKLDRLLGLAGKAGV